MPFYRIKYIEKVLNIKNNNYDNEQFEKLKNNFKVNSYEELSKLINTDNTNTFINNRKFMQF